jgi:hypothetical protein
VKEHSVLLGVARAAQGAALALLLFLPGCLGPGGGDREALDPRFAPAIESLGQAVAAGDDDVARRILAGVLARRPEGRALELARSFEAVLEGREVRDALRLTLVARDLPVEDGEALDGYRLALICENTDTRTLGLFFPPPTLRLLANWAFPVGTDARTVESRTFDGLHGLVLEPGESVCFELGEYHPRLGDALAQRDLWTLITRSGEVDVGGRRVPVAAPDATPCEVVRLAGFLPTAELTPEGLVEYVQRPKLFLPSLMERTVRIPPQRWLDTLAALVPLLDEMDDERVRLISPALRWLSRSARIGADPGAWRRVLTEERVAQARFSGLDLPDPRAARPAGDGPK